MAMLWIYLVEKYKKEYPPKMKTITNLAYHIKNQYNDLSYFWQFVICLSLAFVTLALGISIFN